MDSNMSAIIDKVRKLAALSQSSNIHESQTATAIMNKIIDEYRLSQADITADQDPLMADPEYIYETGKVTPWKQTLLYIIAKHYGCVAIIFSAPTERKYSQFKLFGRKSDIEVARYMFTWLMSECERLSKLETKGKGRVFASSYCTGFARGIEEQLKASRKAAAETASSTAIVFLNQREKTTKDYVSSLYKNLKSDRSPGFKSSINPYAFADGKDKGKSIHLGNALPSNNKLLGS